MDSAVFELELDMLYGGQVHVKRFTSSRLTIRSDEDVQAIYDAFEKEFSETFSPHVVNKPGGVYLDAMVLKAIVPTEKPEMAEHALGGEDAGPAKKGNRNAYWPELSTRINTDVYQFEKTGVRQQARRAGIDRGGVYHHRCPAGTILPY